METAIKVAKQNSYTFKIVTLEGDIINPSGAITGGSVTKKTVNIICDYIEKTRTDWCLTHIDAVPDNFLFYRDENGDEAVQLIDWEYAGMQDPHVDIAMFCIYALYDKEQIDRLISIYFSEGCSQLIRVKVYAYIAACGLLWSNWCEYKRNLGVEFGEYSLRQYCYARDYYKIVKRELESMGMDYDC